MKNKILIVIGIVALIVIIYLILNPQSNILKSAGEIIVQFANKVNIGGLK